MICSRNQVDNNIQFPKKTVAILINKEKNKIQARNYKEVDYKNNYLPNSMNSSPQAGFVENLLARMENIGY